MRNNNYFNRSTSLYCINSRHLPLYTYSHSQTIEINRQNERVEEKRKKIKESSVQSFQYVKGFPLILEYIRKVKVRLLDTLQKCN